MSVARPFIEAGIRGEFEFALHKDGKDVKLFDKPSKNLILDAFLNAIYSGSLTANTMQGGVAASVRVGSGTTPPTPADTALTNPILIGTNRTVVSRNVQYVPEIDKVRFRAQYRVEFAPAVSGANISEVAVYTNTTGNPTASQPIVSRALVLDALGEPTTISITTGDILVVFYTLEVYEPGTIEMNVTVDGVPTVWQSRRVGMINMEDWPWSFSYAYGIAGSLQGNASFRSSDFTLPTPGAALSTAGWTSAGSYTNNYSAMTPLSSATDGLRRRLRVLSAAMNSPTLHGIAATGTGWVHKFTPPFEKTNLDVIDVEVLLRFFRI